MVTLTLPKIYKALDSKAPSKDIIVIVTAYLSELEPGKLISTHELADDLLGLKHFTPERKRLYVFLAELAKGSLEHCTSPGPVVTRKVYGKLQTFRPKMWHKPTPVVHICDHCEWAGPSHGLSVVQDLQSRVKPGETMPAGDCPDCGGLVY